MSQYNLASSVCWVDSVRTRGVPELGRLFIYTPETPALYAVNEAGWLLFELCENASVGDVVSEWPESGSVRSSEADVLDGIRWFVKRGIVNVTAMEDSPAP